MAQIPEIDSGRAPVLDADITLRGVLGTRVRALIERYADGVSLLTPQSCVDGVHEYLPSLCAKRGWSPEVGLETLGALLTGVQIVPNAALAALETEAKRRIAARDPDDWPVIALALAIDAPSVDGGPGLLWIRGGHVDNQKCGNLPQ